MEFYLAEHAGFCYGVKRAINIATKELESKYINENIYSLGPLIHNQQEVSRLEEMGLKNIKSIESIDDGKIIIRSHGITEQSEDKIRKSGFKIIDTTCPYVKAIHKRVKRYYNLGYNIIIIGDPSHPEIIGINGWCDNKAYVLNKLEDFEELPFLDKIYVVSQTTNTMEKFETFSSLLKSKGNEVVIYNSICKATDERQTSTANLAKKVDAMIVIGGYGSANTKKLYEISKKSCTNVYHIEKIEDLTLQELLKFNTIGITAGASTPDWIIKEAIETMNNLNDNEMMAAIESSFTKINRGDIIKGQIIFVTDNEVMVNINYKSDGIISKSELLGENEISPKEQYSQGDEIEVYVVKVDDGEGNVVLSAKRVAEFKNWDLLEENYNNNDLLDAKVLRTVKGGVIAEVLGINGFIPASQISANYVSNLEQFNNQEFKVKIIDFNKQKRRIILSRKEVELKELEKKREELWGSLEVGAIVKGTVQRLADFGAFVDLGGIDGLIHISDLSWNRVKHPSKIVNPNDKVEVQILSFDKEKNRVSLGLKQTLPEPWMLFEEEIKVDDIIDGQVVNLLDFGAFIRLAHGIDGLLHVSQISNEHIDKPSDVLKIGQSITVKVIGINLEDRKVSLSIKEIEKSEEENSASAEKDSEIHEKEFQEVTIEDLINNQ